MTKLPDREGAAVVMVTHDLDVAAQAQRAVVLSDGRLIKNLENPTRQELFQALDANNGSEEKL